MTIATDLHQEREREREIEGTSGYLILFLTLIQRIHPIEQGASVMLDFHATNAIYATLIYLLKMAE